MATTKAELLPKEAIETETPGIKVPVIPSEYLMGLIDRIDKWLREEHLYDPAKYQHLLEGLKTMVAEVSDDQPSRATRVLEKIREDLEKFERSRGFVDRQIEKAEAEIDQGNSLGPFDNAEDAMQALREKTL